VLKDIDNNTYSFVSMGEHLWTTSNLKVTHFRNGEAIPQAQGAADWLKATKTKSPAWCYYEDAQGIDQTTVLYNWYAVNDPRGLAPDGTHIPSINEWTNLINTIGGIKKCARIFKSTEGWITPQATLTHPYNLFNALPVGCRYSYLEASFNWEIGPSKGRYTNFWTSSHGQYGLYGDHANRIGLSYDVDGLINDASSKTQFKNSQLNLKGNGYSVRCIKDPLP
jgi:uncharacterized protein (TIGR02145 family)